MIIATFLNFSFGLCSYKIRMSCVKSGAVRNYIKPRRRRYRKHSEMTFETCAKLCRGMVLTLNLGKPIVKIGQAVQKDGCL